MTLPYCCVTCGEQNPNCINNQNAEEFVEGTINGVIQPPEVFKFLNGFLTFEFQLEPEEDVEYCLIFDPSVNFEVDDPINENGFDILLRGGVPPVIDTGELPGGKRTWR